MIDGLTLEGSSGVGYASFSGVHVVQAANVLISGTSIHGFINGVTVAGTGAVRVTIYNSKVADNTIGVQVSTVGGLGHAKISNCLILNNATAGVQVIGAGNDALLSGNQVLGSPRSVDLQGGGAARSLGDNVLTSGDAPTLQPKS